jgi:hypothetical protein
LFKLLEGKINLTNAANKWVKKAIPAQKRKMGGKCQHKNCGEKRLSYLQFSHVSSTPICRSGPRGRKEKLADVRAHPAAYRLKCHKHHVADKKDKAHDARMRKLGKRN